MQKLRTSNSDPAGLTGQEIVETLLVESGASQNLPTDESRILSFLGLRQLSFDFMHELDFLEAPDMSPSRLRAALSLNDRLVAVQSNLGDKRSRFSILHEVAHFVLPDHRKKLFLDDDETLNWWSKAKLEREANQIAADLLFQGQYFTNLALDQPLSLKSVLELAPKFGASYEAAARRFVDKHVVPCALLVYEKISRTNEVDFEEDFYRVQYTISSGPFRKQFFRSVESNPNRYAASELYRPKYWGQVTESELLVSHENEQRWTFDTESFSNGYKIFQLIKRGKESP
jgi:IrrE N-terminal-like domain